MCGGGGWVVVEGRWFRQVLGFSLGSSWTKIPFYMLPVNLEDHQLSSNILTLNRIFALILHSMQQKWDQGTVGTPRSTLIESRTALVFQWTLPCPTIHPTWPFIYWLYFCRLCKKTGIRELCGQKGQPSLGLGPA